MSRKIIIETPRLCLYEFTESDAPDFYELNADPEVMRYTGDKAFATVEEARDLVRNYKQYELRGYGRWTMIHKQTGEFIGWCGLRYFEDWQETDIGYRLHRRFWNQGYATEAGKACIEYGFNQLSLPRIIGRARKDNLASIRVLEKLGLAFEKLYEENGEINVLFAVHIHQLRQ
ncbi:MAG: GNAT family N-acetyltransferase [Bacteroidetes bacterium]|nr:MAG: GNAT family N-acetyltransferase [Bacteroidota bacterium]